MDAVFDWGVSLLITSNLNMFDGSSPRNYRDSRETQVLRSM